MSDMVPFGYGLPAPRPTIESAIEGAMVTRISRNKDAAKDQLTNRAAKVGFLKGILQESALEIRVSLAEAKDTYGDNQELLLGIDGIIASGNKVDEAVYAALASTLS
jgi:hypothetical protein